VIVAGYYKMKIHSEQCLFDQWQELSAPLFHTSKFWPVFNEDAVQTFFSSTAPGPVASRDLNVEGITDTKRQIEAFLRHIEPLNENDYACKSEYAAFERERIVLLDLMLSTDNPDKLQACNDELYGGLDKMHYEDALKYLKSSIDTLKPRSVEVKRAQTMLAGVWSHRKADQKVVSEIFAGIESYRLALQPLMKQRFSFLDEIVQAHSSRKNLGAKDAQAILTASLVPTLGPAGRTWSANIVDGAPNVFIDYDQRAVVLPAGREYSLDQIKTLVVHEIGVHVTRSVNGEASHERLSGYGMRGYGPAEEAFGDLLGTADKAHRDGLAYLLEVFGTIDFAAPEHGRSFREIYELTRALVLCLANPDEERLENHLHNFERRAFARVMRMMRLGTSVLVDRSMTKYWRGMLLLGEYFAANQLNQETFDEFFLGKYDCLSKNQLSLIQHHAA